MISYLTYLKACTGKKLLMSLTGLGWSLFVMTHMLGNMLIFVSAEAYNTYGHAIVSNPLIYLVEAGLVVFLAIHVINGVSLTLRNRRAKPVGYAVRPNGRKGASFASRTMIYTGSLLLAFIITHLITFKYGPYYTINYNGHEVRDLHRLVLEVFANPIYVLWYVVSMIFVGIHLYHGVASGFQTLGLYHRFKPFVTKFGYVYAVLVALGFLSQPLYVFLHETKVLS